MSSSNDEDRVPAGDPPPYSLLPENGQKTLEYNNQPSFVQPGAPPRIRLPAEPPRPAQSSSSQHLRPPSSPHPSGRSNSLRHSSSTHSASRSSDSSQLSASHSEYLRPPAPNRSGSGRSSVSSSNSNEKRNASHSSSRLNDSYASTSEYGGKTGLGYGPPDHPPHGYGGPSRPPPQSAPNPPLYYPPGYFCRKCHNTGVKLQNGRTCKDCYRNFGRPANAYYLPPGVTPVLPQPPLVVRPGDPAIGGVLCGRCRGRGLVSDFLFFEDTCPLCHGVGRILS